MPLKIFLCFYLYVRYGNLEADANEKLQFIYGAGTELLVVDASLDALIALLNILALSRI